MGTRDLQSVPDARSAIVKLFLYAIAAAALLPAPPASAEMQRRTLFLGDTMRDYLLFVPDPRPSPESGIPLVVALDGGGAVADMMLVYSRFNEVAAREGFAVAYPYGMNRWWNDGRLIEGRTETDADDVGFIRALVADVDARVTPLDRRRIFATGISNGGFMSLRLACEAADLFAAVAPVAATMPAELGMGCRPSRPVSVIMIHGTADRQVPYVGGHARIASTPRSAIWSADHTIAFWAWHNRCAVREHDGAHVLPLGPVCGPEPRAQGERPIPRRAAPAHRPSARVHLALDVRGRRARGARARAREALAEVGLADKLASFPRELSGGEQQRVAIARATVGEPSATLADEPTAALDGANGHAVMTILARIAKTQGRAVLVVTHHTRLLPFADRVIHIEDGRIVGEETARC